MGSAAGTAFKAAYPYAEAYSLPLTAGYQPPKIATVETELSGRATARAILSMVDIPIRRILKYLIFGHKFQQSLAKRSDKSYHNNVDLSFRAIIVKRKNFCWSRLGVLSLLYFGIIIAVTTAGSRLHYGSLIVKSFTYCRFSF